MAGDWIKVETTTPDKPEVIAIAEMLGIDQDAVVGKLIRIWLWADQQTFDGNAGGNGVSVTFAFLDRCTFVPGFGSALEKVGWLARRPDGTLTFPNFDRHNGTTAKSRALTAKRVAKHKKGNATGNATGNAPGVTSAHPSALPREEKSKNKEIRALVACEDENATVPVDTIVDPDDPQYDWVSATSGFMALFNDSPQTSHLTAGDIPYEMASTFRSRWHDKAWRDAYPKALARLASHPPWHGRKVSLREFLSPLFVFDFLNGVYGDAPATPRNAATGTDARRSGKPLPAHLTAGGRPVDLSADVPF